MADRETEITEAMKARRRRANVVVALALGAFVVLVFIVTIVRLGGRIFEHM